MLIIFPASEPMKVIKSTSKNRKVGSFLRILDGVARKADAATEAAGNGAALPSHESRALHSTLIIRRTGGSMDSVVVEKEATLSAAGVVVGEDYSPRRARFERASTDRSARTIAEGAADALLRTMIVGLESPVKGAPSAAREDRNSVVKVVRAPAFMLGTD